MPIAFSWQFPQLDVFPTHEGLTNVVEAVHWRLNADDGAGHTATAYGEQEMGPVDPDNFTPYANLTAAQVQGWVESEMGVDGVNAVQVQLTGIINEQATPTCIGMAPPWA